MGVMTFCRTEFRKECAGCGGAGGSALPGCQGRHHERNGFLLEIEIRVTLFGDAFVNKEGEDDERELGSAVDVVLPHDRKELPDESGHLEIPRLEPPHTVNEAGDVVIENFTVEVTD